MKNAHKPAMPINTFGSMGDVSVSTNDFMGLTKREMLAMHSPSDVPEWYRKSFVANTSMIEKPVLSERESLMMRECVSKNYGISDEDFKVGLDALLIMDKYNKRVEIETEKQIYFSWKICHADALLKELEK